MALTETFVIRIYRRGRLGGKCLIGTVESVNTEQIRKFGSFDELRSILEHHRFPSVTRRRKRRVTGSRE
jgi:hypothetical protein